MRFEPTGGWNRSAAGISSNYRDKYTLITYSSAAIVAVGIVHYSTKNGKG